MPGTIRALVRGEQPVIRSDGTFVRDYLHVDDVVDAYLALADWLDAVESPAAEPGGIAFNFSDEAPLTVLEIYGAVCDAYGEHVDPAVLGEAAGEIHDQFLDASRAHTVLGWKTEVELAGGMARTVDWYRTLLADRELHCGRAPGAHPRARRRVPRRGVPRAAVRAGRDADPGVGEGGGAARVAQPVRRRARPLAHRGALRRRARGAPRRHRRCAPRLPVQLGIVGQPPRGGRAAVASPRRSSTPAGRRGGDGGGRIPHHRESDRPARPRAGVRRRRARHLRRADRSRGRRDRTSHPRHRDGAHPRQPVRSRSSHAARARARVVPRGGQLRRARRALPRATDRDVRRSGDAELLPGAPDDHRRRWLCAHRSRSARQDRRVVARLGSRLLVRAGNGEHLRQAVRMAARRSAVRLRPQVRVLARRVQPQAHRFAGGRRPRATGSARRLRVAASGATGDASPTASPISRSTSCCRARHPAASRVGSGSP